MSDVKWYSVGEIGESVLDAVEAVSDGTITAQRFINELRLIGLSDQEIMDVFAKEVVGV